MKRKSIYAELGDEARRRQLEGWRKKYGTGSDALNESAASVDAAGEAAQLPDASAIAAKVAAKGLDASDVVSDADAWAEKNREALAALEEDEEDAKWMAKQKG